MAGNDITNQHATKDLGGVIYLKVIGALCYGETPFYLLSSFSILEFLKPFTTQSSRLPSYWNSNGRIFLFRRFKHLLYLLFTF